MALLAKRIGPVICACAVGLFVSTAAQSETLKGAKFVTLMKRNTLSGRDSKGASFNLYFLAGGIARYADNRGGRDTGRWRISKSNRLCVIWRNWRPGREHCYVVRRKGRTVTWSGAGGKGAGLMRGFIAASFLKAIN